MKRQVEGITRRGFLISMGTAAVPMILPGSVLGLDGGVAPSEQIAIGSIGVGPRGTAVMQGFMAHKDARIVAVCDLKKWVREGAQQAVHAHYGDKDCQAYEDYRALLEREDIDAARAGLDEIRAMFARGGDGYRLFVLDEANIATHFRLFSVEELLDLIDRKPRDAEVVITGRKVDPRVLERADLATEMREVKHYYAKGVEARTGIEC